MNEWNELMTKQEILNSSDVKQQQLVNLKRLSI